MRGAEARNAPRRSRRSAWLAVLGNAVSAAACAGPPLPLPFVFARAGCTGEDIPGVEIVLTRVAWNGEGETPRPNVRIEAAGLRGRADPAVPLTTKERDRSLPVLVRARLYAERGAGMALSGSLGFAQDGPHAPVSGSYHFCTSADECFDGSFTAPWRPGPALCG